MRGLLCYPFENKRFRWKNGSSELLALLHRKVFHVTAIYSYRGYGLGKEGGGLSVSKGLTRNELWH